MHCRTLLASVPFALIAAPVWAQAYQPRPLPGGKESLIWRTLRIKELEFRKQCFVQNYRKHGKGDPNWDADVVAMLGDFLEGMDTTQATDKEWLADTRVDLTMIRGAGCNDPLINYAIGRLWYAAGDFKKAVANLAKAEEQLKTMSYPASVKRIVTYQLYAACHHAGDKGQAQKHQRESLSLLIQSAADKDYKGGNQRYWILALNRMYRAEKEMPRTWKGLVERLEKTEGVDPWILHLCSGLWGVTYAWKARGNKFAHKVPKEAFKEFDKRLAVAERHLRAAHALHPEFPEAATGMIDVAMAKADSHLEVRKWFDRAVAAQFDYSPAYSALLNAYRPRWQGTLPLMLEFGRECLQTKRFDTVVPDYLGNAIWWVGADMKGGLPEILNQEGIYELLIRFLDGCAAEPRRASRRHYWLSFRVLLDYTTGRIKEAAAQYRTLAKDFDNSVFKLFKLKEATVLAKFAELEK